MENSHRPPAPGGRERSGDTAQTPYVALVDDDTWWAPGSLRRAADLLDAHPGIAVVTARVLVGDEERLDPACVAMAASPLPRNLAVPAGVSSTSRNWWCATTSPLAATPPGAGAC